MVVKYSALEKAPAALAHSQPPRCSCSDWLLHACPLVAACDDCCAQGKEAMTEESSAQRAALHGLACLLVQIASHAVSLLQVLRSLPYKATAHASPHNHCVPCARNQTTEASCWCMVSVCVRIRLRSASRHTADAEWVFPRQQQREAAPAWPLTRLKQGVPHGTKAQSWLLHYRKVHSLRASLLRCAASMESHPAACR